MGEIVAGFGVPHTPMFPALVKREGPQCETAQLYRAVAGHLEAIKPDALVVFDSDHLNTFFLNNYPNLSIGVTDQTTGPNDGTPELPQYTVPVSEDLAGRLYSFGLQSGFDRSPRSSTSITPSWCRCISSPRTCGSPSCRCSSTASSIRCRPPGAALPSARWSAQRWRRCP